jgi:hypothetical protein
MLIFSFFFDFEPEKGNQKEVERNSRRANDRQNVVLDTSWFHDFLFVAFALNSERERLICCPFSFSAFMSGVALIMATEYVFLTKPQWMPHFYAALLFPVS